MFVVYKVYLLSKIKSTYYERMKEFKTLEEAEDFLKEQKTTSDVSYTIMME